MKINFNTIKEKAAQVALSAKDTAVTAVDAGKLQAKLLDSQNKLAKAERQLGALVYSLTKSGEENQELVAKYIENIDELNTIIEQLNAEMEPIKAQAADAYENAKGKAADLYVAAKDKAAAAVEAVKNLGAEEEAVEEDIVEDIEEAAETVEETAEEVVETVEEAAPVVEETPVAPVVEEPVAAAPKTCPHCGAEVSGDELFCGSCGNQL